MKKQWTFMGRKIFDPNGDFHCDVHNAGGLVGRLNADLNDGNIKQTWMPGVGPFKEEQTLR